MIRAGVHLYIYIYIYIYRAVYRNFAKEGGDEPGVFKKRGGTSTSSVRGSTGRQC